LNEWPATRQRLCQILEPPGDAPSRQAAVIDRQGSVTFGEAEDVLYQHLGFSHCGAVGFADGKWADVINV